MHDFFFAIVAVLATLGFYSAHLRFKFKVILIIMVHTWKIAQIWRNFGVMPTMWSFSVDFNKKIPATSSNNDALQTIKVGISHKFDHLAHSQNLLTSTSWIFATAEPVCVPVCVSVCVRACAELSSMFTICVSSAEYWPSEYTYMLDIRQIPVCAGHQILSLLQYVMST